MSENLRFYPGDVPMTDEEKQAALYPTTPPTWLNMLSTVKDLNGKPLSPLPPVADIATGKLPELPTMPDATSAANAPAPQPQNPWMDQAGQGYGGSSKMSMPTIDPEIRALLKKQVEGIGLQKQGISDLEHQRDAMPTGPQGLDLTGLMMLADAWGDKNGKVFTGAYRAPETGEQREALKRALQLQIQKAKQGLTDDEVNVLKAQLGVKQHQMMQSAMMDQKMSADDDRARWNIIKWTETEKNSGRLSPLGKAQTNVDQASRIQALIDQYKGDLNKMPLTGPSSLSELAIGLNGLLGQNGGSEESRKSLIPASARGKASTIEQFFANKPTGAEMAEFVKNAQDTLRNEVNVNQGILNKFHERAKASTGTLGYAKRHPQEFEQLLKSQLNDPSAAANTGGGFPKQVVNSRGEVATVSNSSELQEAMKEGFK